MKELRCGDCDYWIGEASTELVLVATIQKNTDPPVQSPRDLRLCKGCGKVSVFVARTDLYARMQTA